MSQLYPLMSLEKLRNVLKEIMNELKISQKQLASSAGLHQSDMSELLSGNRKLRYDEAKEFIDFILSYYSAFLKEEIAYDYCTKRENLCSVTSQETIENIVTMMYENGYSQVPVIDEDNDKYDGIVTEKKIMEFLVMPRDSGNKSIEYLKGETIEKNWNFIVTQVPKYSSDTSLALIGNVLRTYPAIMLENGSHINGIITRADFLKILKKDVKYTICPNCNGAGRVVNQISLSNSI